MEVGREEYAIVKGKSAGEDDRENKALLEWKTNNQSPVLSLSLSLSLSSVPRVAQKCPAEGC
jgi:hypothetical protein